MKIIKYKKLKDNRYEIELDNSKIILYDDVIVKYNLLYDKEIDDKILKKITDFNDELNAYYKAIKYINLRLRSAKEIKKYLEKNNYSKDIIKNTISKLKKEGFINNKLYLESFINDQIKFSINGPFKIKLMLNNLGFNDEEINIYLNKINYHIWDEKIAKIINKKSLLNKKEAVKIFKEKVAIYLNNLGYSYDMYSENLDNIKFNDEEIILKDISKIKSKLATKYNGDELNFYLKQKLYAKGYSSELINKYIN